MSKRQSVRMTRGRRSILIMLCAITAWHVFASFLWIGPYSGLRQVVPGDLLRQYMIPMFGQSWSVFAPDPINGDYRLQIRATVGEGDAAHDTEFVDATAAEFSMLTNSLTPPRGAIQASEIASAMFNAYNKLSDEQKEIVALGYYNGDDWDDRLRDALIATGSESAATTYLAAEERVNAYATQVAYAVWGGDVTHVQFTVSRQNVVPFEDRHNPDAQRPAVQPVPTGFRGLIEYPGQSRDAFADVFLRGMQHSGQGDLIETQGANA